jgi:hypothetical protein
MREATIFSIVAHHIFYLLAYILEEQVAACSLYMYLEW